MNIVSTLNEKLLKQPFEEDLLQPALLAKHRQTACRYAETENSIAVLSDLKSNKSYIYNGGLATGLGLSTEESKEIDSIWEEEIFSKIHPDDLTEKHLLELRFFHLLKKLPVSERSDYHIISKIRMLDRSGQYIPIHHRTFYVCSSPRGNLWLALCLYNYSYEKSAHETYEGIIVNSSTGDIIQPDKQKCNDILSGREKEILRLIEEGKISKEIGDLLSISINTVNRHRQNILEKLHVKNSFEACRIAKLMNLL
ncbi:response regulator transcription factor [Parabacteroides sp. APC149_11_2_Y6]